MTWEIFKELPAKRKTAIIKEKDEILANHWAVRYALEILNLKLINITSNYEDIYNKVDLKCENIYTGEINYLQLKYADKNYGDIRVSQRELHAYYYHKNLTSYHLQIVGNQDWLNMNENLTIRNIKILDSSFLKNLINRKGLIGVSNYISKIDADKFFKMGYKWNFYLNPNMSSEKNKICKSSCLVKNIKTDYISFIFKSIENPSPYENQKCYLIPDNLNDICNRKVITHLSF